MCNKDMNNEYTERGNKSPLIYKHRPKIISSKTFETRFAN